MSKRKRGHRLDAWIAKYGEDLPDHYRAYCRQRRPDLNPDAVWEDFCEYWLSKTGHSATKMNWRLTWQGWVRKETRRPHNAHAMPVVQAEEAAQASAVEYSNALADINARHQLKIIDDAQRKAEIANLRAKLT